MQNPCNNLGGLLTVSQMSRSILQGTVLNDIIKEHLIIIDKKMLGISKQIGNNVLVYDLPITFISAPSSTTDTKIMVYYHILRNLESRGYGVKLDLDNNKARLHIEWVIGLSKENIQEMENYLNSKSL